MVNIGNFCFTSQLPVSGDIKMSISMPPETVKLKSIIFHNSEILIAYYDSLYFFKHFLLLPFPPFLKETLLNLNLNIYSSGKVSPAQISLVDYPFRVALNLSANEFPNSHFN